MKPTYLIANEIVTVDSPQYDVLFTKTQDIGESELDLAKEIADKLLQVLVPLSPAAGLAAPQIGISRSVFIYSFDRDPKNLVVVINPSFVPVGESEIVGWEACFSAQLTNGVCIAAKLPRYEKIEVSYTNLEGKREKKILEGFAAKVFQHEYDHLQGTVCIDKPGSSTQEFKSQNEMISFMQEVKKQDANRYLTPS
jgi:peptide deformylase